MPRRLSDADLPPAGTSASKGGRKTEVAVGKKKTENVVGAGDSRPYHLLFEKKV